MPDSAPAIDGGMRSMTYAELAKARGISVLAARRLTLRRHWAKLPGNDGLVRVSVPTSALESRRKTGPSRAAGDATTDTTRPADDAVSDAASDTETDTTRALVALASAVGGLRQQLDRAEATITDLRQQLDQAHDDRRQTADRLAAAQERIAAVLSDQRPTAAPPATVQPRSPWRRFLAWSK